MRKRRIFMNPNSQIVRTLDDLAFERTDIEFQIERKREEIRDRPAVRSLTGVLAKFSGFSPDFMSGGRGDHEQTKRNR